MQICIHDAKEVFGLLNSRDKVLNIDHLVEILKQNAPEEAGKPEPQESATAMVVLKMTEELGLTAADIKVLEKINLNKQSASITRQWVKMLPW